jgi:uncharacterized Zn finger protein (UPF0148 family)
MKNKMGEFDGIPCPQCGGELQEDEDGQVTCKNCDFEDFTIVDDDEE